MEEARVTLTPDEAIAARGLGRKREELRVVRGKSGPEYQDNGGTHVERNELGALAEYALAKSLGPDTLRDWVENKAFSLNHKNIPCDVGVNLHVRATKRLTGGLILHPSDPDRGAFVLALVEGLTVTFRGWIRCQAGKQQEYWRDTGPGFGKRPAYVVPQDELLTMNSLRPEDVR